MTSETDVMGIQNKEKQSRNYMQVNERIINFVIWYLYTYDTYVITIK